MRNLTKSLMVGSLLATAAIADYTVVIPGGTADVATTYGVGVDSMSANAKKIKDMSGATYYVGKASSASLTETTLGELSIKYSLVYATADGAYGTSVGILLPLTAAWDIKDLSEMTSMTFQAKCATTGLKIHVIAGSKLYPQDMQDEHSALVSNDAALTTAYSAVTILPGDFLAPTWAKATSAATTGWKLEAPYTVGIGTAVEHLNIQPQLDGSWGTGGTSFLTTAAAQVKTANTITIKEVKILGVRKYKVPAGVGCTGTSAFLDDFSATSWLDASARTGNAANYLGGYWYAFSDTTSDATRINDTAVGMSAITLPAGKRTWMPILGAGAFVTATLEKNVPTSTFPYHAYAGWTDIGTDLTSADPITGEPVGTDFTAFGTGSLSSIGFDLYAGAAAASVVTGASFDTTLIERITLKLGKSSTTDDAPYQIDIPSNLAVGPDGLPSICVDLSMLAQPSWYSTKHGLVPLVANDVTKIAWEIKIEDQKDPLKHTSTVSTFGIGNVKLYGISKDDILSRATGVKDRKSSAKSLVVTYNGKNLALSFAPAGSQIEVLRLDGSKVASFKASASAKQSFAVNLKRGNYVVTVAGDSKRSATNLAVAN